MKTKLYLKLAGTTPDERFDKKTCIRAALAAGYIDTGAHLIVSNTGDIQADRSVNRNAENSDTPYTDGILVLVAGGAPGSDPVVPLDALVTMAKFLIAHGGKFDLVGLDPDIFQWKAWYAETVVPFLPK
ncbi:hypothetical protein [Rhizobacter sp. Root404]|uniref:hypothetical protein n=1 Tax=Rhizobacter sp. Root404 TaxID=1736528 RepID=UPI0006FFB411|nr:hypothetical protein [Rhizobacter sp. Root404]KQW36736.1 hypothetical protein ASC76_19055 [Rhizobacter sp. Root404]